MPYAHAKQAVAAMNGGEYVSLGHWVHEGERLLLEKVPEEQLVQVVDARLENLPAGQVRHNVAVLARLA